MFLIAFCFLLIFLWCVAMFSQHMIDLSKWNARPEEEKEPLGSYPKPKWSETFGAMGLGTGFILVVAVGIIGWLFF